MFAQVFKVIFNTSGRKNNSLMLCKYKLEVCGMCQHQPEYVVPYHVDFFFLVREKQACI